MEGLDKNNSFTNNLLFENNPNECTNYNCTNTTVGDPKFVNY